jgi:DNA-directed RNA polymerase subunit K/omega
MLMKGAKPLVESTNRPIVVALREVAAGKVKFDDGKTEDTLIESSETES